MKVTIDVGHYLVLIENKWQERRASSIFREHGVMKKRTEDEYPYMYDISFSLKHKCYVAVSVKALSKVDIGKMVGVSPMSVMKYEEMMVKENE